MTHSPKKSPHKEMRLFAWILAAIILSLAGLATIASIRAERPIVVTAEPQLTEQELQEMVVYEQDVETPDGDIVTVRTHAGEAADEAALWALHKSRVDRVKAG